METITSGSKRCDGWLQDRLYLVVSLRLQPGLRQEVRQPLIGTHRICVYGILPALSMGNPVAIKTETLHILIRAARDKFLERLDGLVKPLSPFAEWLPAKR